MEGGSGGHPDHLKFVFHQQIMSMLKTAGLEKHVLTKKEQPRKVYCITLGSIVTKCSIWKILIQEIKD